MSPEEQNEILRLLQGNDEAVDIGLERLYTRMGPDFLRHFVWRGLSSDEAQDVLQETIVKIAGGATRAKSLDRAGAWFWRIAKNCLIDHFRSRSDALSTGISDGTSGSSDDDTSPVQHVAGIDLDHLDQSFSLGARSPGEAPNREAERCVSLMINGRFREEMPDRAYVLLQWVEGASIRQIAEFLDRSEDATKTFLYECRKKAKPFFQECFDLLFPM